jgi:hypothetical protein
MAAAGSSAVPVLAPSSSDVRFPATSVSPEAAAALQHALTQTTNHFRRVPIVARSLQLFTFFLYLRQQRYCAFA